MPLTEESVGAEGPVGRVMCESVVRRYARDTMCMSRQDTRGAISEMWDFARTHWETEDPAVAGPRFKYGRGRWASVGRLLRICERRRTHDRHMCPGRSSMVQPKGVLRWTVWPRLTWRIISVLVIFGSCSGDAQVWVAWCRDAPSWSGKLAEVWLRLSPIKYRLVHCQLCRAEPSHVCVCVCSAARGDGFVRNRRCAAAVRS